MGLSFETMPYISNLRRAIYITNFDKFDLEYGLVTRFDSPNHIYIILVIKLLNFVIIRNNKIINISCRLYGKTKKRWSKKLNKARKYCPISQDNR